MKFLICSLISTLLFVTTASAELDSVFGCNNPRTIKAGSGNINMAIPPSGSISSNIVLAAFGTHLVDVDLKVNITHAFPTDLDIFLKSPTGTRIMITTDNGGSATNAFNGTLFDDFGPSINDSIFAANQVSQLLCPEGPLAGFQGENPNGAWTLEITDDFAPDGGNLASWELHFSTCDGPPISTPERIFASSAVVPVPDVQTASSSIQVNGVGSDVCDLAVQTFLEHTFPGDIDMLLRGPGGVRVTLTTDNGGSAVNAFNGTVWKSKGVDTVTNTTFTANVVKAQVSPEGSLGGFYQSSADGTWTLEITDDASGDIGQLVGWALSLRACGPDADSDGTLDEEDGCPLDAAKSEPGVCGCGFADVDPDGDGKASCIDECPSDTSKSGPGKCGCGVLDTDTDGDNVPNCIDQCSSDPLKVQAGICGCGVRDVDDNGNGFLDCDQKREFKKLVENANAIFSTIKSAKTKKAKKRQRSRVTALLASLQATSDYLARPGVNIASSTGGTVTELHGQASTDLTIASKKLSKKALRKAKKSIDALLAALG